MKNQDLNQYILITCWKPDVRGHNNKSEGMAPKRNSDAHRHRIIIVKAPSLVKSLSYHMRVSAKASRLPLA